MTETFPWFNARSCCICLRPFREQCTTVRFEVSVSDSGSGLIGSLQLIQLHTCPHNGAPVQRGRSARSGRWSHRAHVFAYCPVYFITAHSRDVRLELSLFMFRPLPSTTSFIIFSKTIKTRTIEDTTNSQFLKDTSRWTSILNCPPNAHLSFAWTSSDGVSGPQFLTLLIDISFCPRAVQCMFGATC